jgi:hypothetical protein
MSAGVHFGPGTVVAVWGDSIVAVVNAYAGDIHYYVVDHGGIRPLRDRALGWIQRRAVVSGPLDRSLREARAASRPGVSPDDFEIRYPVYHAFVQRALFADNGDLWLRREKDDPTSTRIEPQSWHVVPWDTAREPFNVILPEGFLLYGISADSKLIGFHRSPDGVARLRVYQLTGVTR